VVAGAIAVAICLAWPWYSFWVAVRLNPDNAYWFNPSILVMMFSDWCAPGLVLSLLALGCSDRRNARILLTLLAAFVGLGVLAAAVRSPSRARVALPAMVFGHMAIGLFADETGVFDLRTWPGRLKAIIGDPQAAARPIMDVVLILAVGRFLVPQVFN